MRRPLAVALLASLVGQAALGDEVGELRQQVEQQNELIRQQAVLLQQMGDRVRSLEDEQLEAERSAERAAVSASGPSAHVPGSGFPVGESQSGSMNLRIHTYARYLSQKGIDSEYTDSFGITRPVDERQDVQLNKAALYAFGWAIDPRLRYMLYVWSANTSQGLGAQVVVAGNLHYRFSEHFTLGGGIGSLPGTRSTSGTWPLWLGVDHRLIADEFFRPSYTSGIWASGQILEGLDYYLMLGNNLSQLGVDAGQLDEGLNTVTAALTLEPMGPYGKEVGDFEQHEQLASLLGLRFTYSREDRQGQPDTEAFENVQLRLSDGNVIFEPDLFDTDLQIERADYQMLSLDGGLKYQGFALEGEYYFRRLSDFSTRGTGALAFDELDDHGFQLQASAMLLPRKVQAYVSGSKIYGEHGDPWDARAGLNWWPFENQGIRWNNELIYVQDSPVGALSLPYLVGSKGLIFVSNFEVFF